MVCRKGVFYRNQILDKWHLLEHTGCNTITKLLLMHLQYLATSATFLLDVCAGVCLKRDSGSAEHSKTPQKLCRLRWVRAHKHYNFKKVIFSDEKRFAKRPDGPSMVWRLPGESRDPRCTQKHTKFGGGGLLIWGAIADNKKFPLVLSLVP